MAVPWVVGFVRGGVPVEVKEKIWFIGDFPSGHMSGAMRREGGYGSGEACCDWFHLWRRADKP